MSLSKNNKFKVDYLILAAMDEELEFLKEKFSTLKYVEIQINELFFKIYNYQNHQVLVSATGIGTTFSASIITLIHDYFDPDYFFFLRNRGWNPIECKD